MQSKKTSSPTVVLFLSKRFETQTDSFRPSILDVLGGT